MRVYHPPQGNDRGVGMLAFRRSRRAVSKPALWLIAIIVLQGFWNPPAFVSRLPSGEDNRVGGFEYVMPAGAMGVAEYEYGPPRFAGWTAPASAVCQGGSGPAVGDIWRILYDRDDIDRPDVGNDRWSLVPASVDCPSDVSIALPDVPYSDVLRGAR